MRVCLLYTSLDEQVIDESIAEARLTEQLGFDALWLAEHHFDGICAVSYTHLLPLREGE